MRFNYNIIEYDSVIIIYYYKVGSRFLDTYSSSNFNIKKYSINLSENNAGVFDGVANLKIGKYYVEPTDESTNGSAIHSILTNKLIHKPILLIYRNPYQKTISGLVEDFHEEFMRRGDSTRYIDMDSFYEYVQDTNYSKLHLMFLNKLCNGLNTMETFELISSDSELEYNYINLLKKYVEYRISIAKIGERGHTEFHTYNTFIILNEFNKNQKYVLVNLDDKNTNLQNILDTYCKNKNNEYINKNDFSNNGYKSKLNSVLDLKVKEELYKILENEMQYYNILNNKTPIQ
jgi:hypothetical protein